MTAYLFYNSVFLLLRQNTRKINLKCFYSMIIILFCIHYWICSVTDVCLQQGKSRRSYCTVGIWNPTIRKPETFENRTFQRSVFELSGFQMVGTSIDIYGSYSYGPDHSKTGQFKMVASLDHFIYKKEKMSIKSV